VTGTLDDGPDALTRKGEFFTSQRKECMPKIPGMTHSCGDGDCRKLTSVPDTSQKQEVKT
jgi:hypothetical protein